MSTNEQALQVTINDANLPEVINEQVSKLNDLQTKVNKAFSLAEDAKDSAEAAYKHSAGLGHKKGAIEALQTSGKNQANALKSMAEAQKLSFENQQKLAEITKFLFEMGVTNIAMNRNVVRELQLKLSGASKEKLSKLAQEEIANVVRQLKAQEDILKKQAAVEVKVRENTQKLTTQEQKNAEQDDELARQAEKDAEHDEKLAQQAEKDAEHDKELARQAQKDDEHDKLLSQLAANIETHDERFAQQELVNAEHDRLLAQQEEKDLDHDRRLDEQAEALKEHGERLNDLERRADEHDSALAQHGTDIAGNTDTIQEQAALIVQLNEEISALKLALETKASKKADLVSLILAGASLLGVIIHFCI